MDDGLDATGVLVVRVWREADGSLRARVTRTTDVVAGGEVSEVVSGVLGVRAAVDRFLADYARAQDDATADS